ncbi:MAG TPA: transcription factor [Candidatus Angelobacter sp.]
MDLNTRRSIKAAINGSPRNCYVAELHAQVLKYADQLRNMTGKEFCDELEIPVSYGTEYSKMIKLADRLKKAGSLDTTKI